MRRVVVLAGLAAALVACPDLSGLSANFDAAADVVTTNDATTDVAPQDVTVQDVAPDVAQIDCGVARRVQAVHYNDTSNVPDAGIALVLPIAQSAGDFILATVNYDPATCGTAVVSDAQGNKYVKLIAADSAIGAEALETWGAQNVASADQGQNTVSVTFTNACYAAMKVIHYTGIATTASVESTTTEHGDMDSGAPTQTLTVTAPALLFAHTADQGSAYEAGVGWSFVMLDDWATLAEERDALEAGAYLVDYTHNAENWVIQGVALRRCP